MRGRDPRRSWPRSLGSTAPRSRRGAQTTGDPSGDASCGDGVAEPGETCLELGTALIGEGLGAVALAAADLGDDGADDLVVALAGSTSTTIHLHSNIKQDVAGVGFIFVSPYRSLVESYQDLLGLGGETIGDAAVDSCSAVVGWARDENALQDALSVQVYFDGAPGDRRAVGVEVLAGEYRESLCEMLGSCEHGFMLELPRSLQDGQEHPIKLFSGGSEDSAAAEIETSSSFACDTPAIPNGELRRIGGPEAVSAWGLSPFWDTAVVDDATSADLSVGESFPERPVLARTEGDGAVWWMDPGSKPPAIPRRDSVRRG